MKKTLQRWHWLHTWTPWKSYNLDFVRYLYGIEVSRTPGTRQGRKCTVCNLFRWADQ